MRSKRSSRPSVIFSNDRRAALGAGVTIYCRDPVPVYANERLVAVHMAQGGDKTIALPADCVTPDPMNRVTTSLHE